MCKESRIENGECFDGIASDSDEVGTQPSGEALACFGAFQREICPESDAARCMMRPQGQGPAPEYAIQPVPNIPGKLEPQLLEVMALCGIEKEIQREKHYPVPTGREAVNLW